MSGLRAVAADCAVEAISMNLREDREEPFERVFDMGMAILEAKRANAKKM
jgi:hypothetical protein